MFKYYKHLLSLSSKGSPASILKCINPKEAKLLDDASGVHIRFRLMGVCFVFYRKCITCCFKSFVLIGISLLNLRIFLIIFLKF